MAAGGADDRRSALKDAVPDREPPWAINQMGKKPQKKGTPSGKVSGPRRSRLA
jgi:hypothetical protein